jgi:hypothetical protein
MRPKTLTDVSWSERWVSQGIRLLNNKVDHAIGVEVEEVFQELVGMLDLNVIGVKTGLREIGEIRGHDDLGAARAIVMSRLALTEKGPGYVHLPATDWADEELALQLTSERLVTGYTRGIRTTVWKKIRMRNEALDCLVLAYAALRLLNPKLDMWREHIARVAARGSSAASSSAGGKSVPTRRPRPRRFAYSTYLMS